MTRHASTIKSKRPRKESANPERRDVGGGLGAGRRREGRSFQQTQPLNPSQRLQTHPVVCERCQDLD
uniref:(California timema) hypothetical protein n=1 Tax=Timema californicum TaxID=61474 RepID=A0A7R9IYL9_TIMCA|nr:unnamed protein product [Timema californicum]